VRGMHSLGISVWTGTETEQIAAHVRWTTIGCGRICTLDGRASWTLPLRGGWVSKVLGRGGFEFNHDPETLAGLDFPSEVFLVDSTIRSLQSSVSGSRHLLDDLVAIGLAVDRLGVRELIVNVGWADGLGVIERLAAARPRARLVGTFRATDGRADEYLKAAIRAGVDEVCIESAPSVEVIRATAELVHSADRDISHAFAEPCSWERLLELGRASSGVGARSMSFHDSYFRMSVHPEAMKVFIRRLRQAIPEHPPLYVHLSNFYGHATMTAVAALTAGASAVDVCVNGTGHHCGHSSLAEVAMVLEDLYGVSTGVNLAGISEAVDVVRARSGIPVRLQQPVVGEFAFMLDGSDVSEEAGLPAPERTHSQLPFAAEVVGGEERVVWTHRTATAKALSIRLAALGLPANGTTVSRAQLLLADAVGVAPGYPYWLKDDEVATLLQRELASGVSTGPATRDAKRS